MRKIVAVVVAMISAVAVSAQTTAQEWLTMLSASLGDRYAMHIAVSMDDEPMEGYFMVDGDGYYITLGVMEVYSDGKLRHEVNNERKEVTVDGVDLTSVDLLTNPTKAFDFVGDEFAVSIVESDAKVCVLSLVPRDDAMGVSAIGVTLVRDGSGVVPSSISYDYDGVRVDIAMRIADGDARVLPRWKKDDYRGYDIVSFL
jgi:hypothetical protein